MKHVKFKVDLRIFLFLILFYFTHQVGMYVLVLIFGFIHEIGHLLMGILMGMKPEKVGIMPTGISVSFSIKTKDYNVKIKNGTLLEIKKIVVALAGPLTNVLIILIAQTIPMNIFIYFMILFSNLAIILFNLLPIYPMDGGRILTEILHILIGKRKAMKIVHIISLVTIVISTILASVAILYLKNIAIFLAIIYLWIIIIKENNIYLKREKIYKIIEEY